MTRLNWGKAQSNPRGYESASPRSAGHTPLRGGSHVKPGKVRTTTNPTQHEEGSTMSSGVNKVLILGRLGKDPEVRFTSGGQAVCNFTVATGEEWKDKNDQKQKRTEWHKVVVWGKLAELCGEHLKKGRQCYVEGKLQTREWTDKENRKQYTTEVVAYEVTFLGGKGD